MNRYNSAIEQDWRARARSNSKGRLAAVTPLLVMAVYLYGLRPLVLTAAGKIHPLFYFPGRFCLGSCTQILKMHRGNFHHDVNTIQ